jgi:TatD DNase family protein
MDPRIIDAHTHVHFPEFDSDRDGVIRRALDAGIGMITVGTDRAFSGKAVDVAGQYEGVWATVGFHPHEAKKGISDTQRAEIERLAGDGKVVGIGECGVDMYRDDDRTALEAQRELFAWHIALARRVRKPLVIHCRDAFDQVLNVFGAHKDLLGDSAGVCHFFTGTVEIAKKFLELGFSFTFGGLVTFNREFDGVIRFIPPDRILVETDAPFVAPASHRGQRNEPLYISEVVTALAGVRGESEEETKARTLENTLRLFKLPHRS